MDSTLDNLKSNICIMPAALIGEAEGEDVFRFGYHERDTGEVFSKLDFENFENYSAYQILKKIEDEFGKIRGKEGKENLEQIKEFLLSGIEFRDNSLKINLYNPISKEFRREILMINNSKDLLRIIFDEKNQETMKRLFKIMLGQKHVADFEDKFYPEPNLVINFNRILKSIFTKEEGCKHCFSLQNGSKYIFSLESISSNEKQEDRILQKSIRKASIEMGKMDDILRGRIIIKNLIDLEPIIERLKEEGLLKLQLKNSTENGDRDVNRQDVSLNGNYKGIPVEIQILTEAQHEKNEEGASHHLVYEFIQFCTIIERVDGYIPHEYVKDFIYNLINNKDVLESKVGGVFEKNELENLIWERFNRTFFEVDNKDFYKTQINENNEDERLSPYISYGRSIELKDIKILKYDEERWDSLANVLNEKLKKKFEFTGEEWREIFDNLDDLESSEFRSASFDIMKVLSTIKLTPYYAKKVKKLVTISLNKSL